MKKRIIQFGICLALLNVGYLQLAEAATSCPESYNETGRNSTNIFCDALVELPAGSNTLASDVQANLEQQCTTDSGTVVESTITPNNSTEGDTIHVVCDLPLDSAPTEKPTPGSPPGSPPGPSTPAPASAPTGPANIQGKITDNPLILPGTHEFAVGSAIENLCPQLAFINNPRTAGSLTPIEKDLLVRCGDIVKEGNDQRQITGVRNMSSEEFESQSINLRRMNKAQLGNIAARLAALRPALSQASQDLAFDGRQHHPLPGLASVAPRNARGGAAGDDEIPEDISRLGMFISGVASDGEKEESDRSSGFDFSSTGYTFGVDYLLDLDTVVGVALGYGSSDTDFSRDGGNLETDTTTLSLYGTKFINDSWFLDGVLGLGTSDYESRRNFDYTANGTAVKQAAVGSPESDQLLLSLGAGKSLNKGSVDMDFTGRVNYLNATIDRFAESIEGETAPGFGLALEIDEQDVTSVTSDLSIKISKAISQNFGVVIPQASLAWIHEFDGGEDNLRARFVNDPFSVDFSQSGLNGTSVPTIFEVPLDDSDTDFGRLGLGVNVLLANGLTLNFHANKLLGLEDIDLQYYVFGIRKDL